MDLWDPLRPAPGPELPLRACLLSGGESRRMGRDKALLPHPEGGTWLERSLLLLAGQGMPLTLLSRHQAHHRLAGALAKELAVPLELLVEPPPWEGPLRALGRLMAFHPGRRLLLCPVDMPWLQPSTLRLLLAQQRPTGAGGILIAHDGHRPQPLLGLYPATGENRASLERFTAGGGRSLLGWLGEVGHRTVLLPAAEVHNCNHPPTVPPADPRDPGQDESPAPSGPWLSN